MTQSPSLVVYMDPHSKRHVGVPVPSTLMACKNTTNQPLRVLRLREVPRRRLYQLDPISVAQLSDEHNEISVHRDGSFHGSLQFQSHSAKQLSDSKDDVRGKDKATRVAFSMVYEVSA